MSNNKTIKKRLKKRCSCCNKEIKVVLYNDRSYRACRILGVPEVLLERMKTAKFGGSIDQNRKKW